MKRILSAVLAMAVSISLLNVQPAYGFANATPWVTEFNSTGEVSKQNNSGSDRLVDSGVADPKNASNYVGMIRSYATFAAKTDIGIYKTLAGNQSAFYQTSGATASAGSGVNKIDFYFEDMAVQRRTAPRFGYISTEGTFTITSNFNTFYLFFDTDGKIRQYYQASPTSTVDTAEGNRVVIGSYQSNRWYRMVQELDTAAQTITIKVYDITDESNAFDSGRIKDAYETFNSEPVATGIYYCGYGGLNQHSSTLTGDSRTKGATVLGINGIYVMATVPAATASSFYIDNMAAAPTKATASLALVDTTAGSENKATIVDTNNIIPENFFGKRIQLRLSQPIQNTAGITSITLKQVGTANQYVLPRQSIMSSKIITDSTYPQIMEFDIPSDLVENATYEFVLNGIKDIHGQSFSNLIVNSLSEDFINELEGTTGDLAAIVSDYNNGLDLTEITGNISLPTMTENGFSIVWIKTTDASTLALDGMVNCPPYTEDHDNSKNVKLTAVVSKNGVSRTTDVTFIVKMQDAAPEFYILKAAYQEFSASFKVQDNVITSPIDFPATYKSSSYPNNSVSIRYIVKGTNGTEDEEAKAALTIGNGTCVVNRSSVRGDNKNVTIDVVMSHAGAADRIFTKTVVIPYKNLLTDIGNSVLTDGRPTVWTGKNGAEYILNLEKNIVIGQLFANMDKDADITFYTTTNSAWNKVDEGSFPLEANKIKLVINEATDVKVTEIEAYATANEIAYIDVTKAQINDDISYVTASNIDLPFEGKYGTKFVWSSSDSSTIDQYGTVTRKGEDITVTLTVSAKDSDITDATKSFKVTVAKKVSSSGGGGGGGSGNRGSSVNVTVPNLNTQSNETQASNARFNDMSGAAWAEDYVEYLAANGILSGRGNKIFAPNDNILREEFVKVVLLAFDIKAEDSDVSYFDVNVNEWYYDYIKTATAAGIIQGYDNRFGVGEKISREDMAVILLRAAAYKNIALQEVKEVPSFADEGLVRVDAKTAMTALAKANILSGYEDNTIRPKNSATRAETAKLVYGVLKSVGLLK